MPGIPPSSRSFAEAVPDLETAAAAVTAARRALEAARRELSAAIREARQCGEPVRAIAQRTGLHPTMVLNILAVPPPATPRRDTGRPR
ncbi:hypothetical protein [Streptomyces cinereoruber]|uniref:hypothetical protein n=1 Tax=Streptomyces cinereoruber TaxID=67260 RepID=UPI003667C948